MKTHFVALVSILLAAAGCGGGETAPSGHTLTLTANLKADGGQLAFMTPAISIIKVPVEQIVGKPYLVASFPAGFSPGNDPPIDHTWGTVPADLTIRYTTPATYKDGAYDMVLVVYATTPITKEIQDGPAQSSPPATKGDLATFTADTSVVKPGDPSIPAGLVRLNVEGSDATATVANKTPADPSNQDQLKASIANTIMIIP